MDATHDGGTGFPRRAAVGAAVAFGIQAVALAVLLLAAGQGVQLPVIASFRSGTRANAVPIATIDLGWALVAVLAGGAIALALAAGRARRPHLLLLAGWSQGSAIVVYLVAQLNGIAEVSSLVPLYAIAATAVLLQGIDAGVGTATWRRSGAWAAAVGIVPWGVIAFAQIGAGFAVGTLSVGVRVVTLLALVTAVAAWWIAWRRPGAATRSADVVALTVAVSAVAWAAAALTVFHPM